jgi:metal-dependent amidase/aminoacylase/carboxypeptidase family protein
MRSRAPGSLAAAEADLLALSRRIHARPELAFEEECAADGWRLLDAADSASGVASRPPPHSSPRRIGPLHVAICAEYDALPDISHACG